MVTVNQRITLNALTPVVEITAVRHAEVRKAHLSSISNLVEDAEIRLKTIRSQFMLLSEPSCDDARWAMAQIDRDAIHRAVLALAFYAARSFHEGLWGVTW